MKKRRALRLSVVLALLAIVSTLFVGGAYAAAPNSLTVHFEDGKYRPTAVAIWRLPGGGPDDLTEALSALAQLTDAQVTTALPGAVRLPDAAVGQNGNAVVTGLADGRYYLREAAGPPEATEEMAPLVFDLPQTNPDGTPLREVTVYPKSRLKVVPPVPTPMGGARFLKVDPAGRPLAGATFVVLTASGDGYARLLVGGQAITATSATDGTLAVDGLPFGTYYLRETTAPAGYQLLVEAVPFTVDATTRSSGPELRITNEPVPTGLIPKTGDTALLLSMVAGLCLIVLGLFLTRGTVVRLPREQ